jgi:hypothetical protein
MGSSPKAQAKAKRRRKPKAIGESKTSYIIIILYYYILSYYVSIFWSLKLHFLEYLVHFLEFV